MAAVIFATSRGWGQRGWQKMTWDDTNICDCCIFNNRYFVDRSTPIVITLHCFPYSKSASGGKPRLWLVEIHAEHEQEDESSFLD
jgi:hypothetical protein